MPTYDIGFFGVTESGGVVSPTARRGPVVVMEAGAYSDARINAVRDVRQEVRLALPTQVLGGINRLGGITSVQLVDASTRSRASMSLLLASFNLGALESRTTCRALLRLRAGGGMTLADVARNIYALWGMEISQLREVEYGRARIAEFCTSAMQLIYAQAHRLEYFNRETLTIQVPPGPDGVELPASVQAVHGDAQIGSRSLRRAGSLAEIQAWSSIYGETAQPLGYLVHSERQARGDGLRMRLYLAPAPAEEVSVSLLAVHEPPRWSAADLLQATAIPLPHGWVETLFLPLVRKWASVDGIMPASRRQQQQGEIDAQFEAARQQLGLAETDPPETAKN